MLEVPALAAHVIFCSDRGGANVFDIMDICVTMARLNWHGSVEFKTHDGDHSSFVTMEPCCA